jgi:hypothetical protein
MTMATMEEIKDMLGDTFPDDLTDEIYKKEFLDNTNSVIAQYGEQWVREHKVMLASQWKYVRTLV